MKKMFLAAAVGMFSLSTLADCRLELNDEVLDNIRDHSFSTPKGLIKTLQKKGYKIRASVYDHEDERTWSPVYKEIANDFIGEANMTLKANIGYQQQGRRESIIASGAEVTLLSASGEVLGIGNSNSIQTGILSKIASPNHVKNAIKQLPDCSDL